MRPIKFRAWDVEGKCWIPDTHICISATGMILTWDEWKKQWIEETIKIIICWYTGLLDKNRAKIFEGNILEYDDIQQHYGKEIRKRIKGVVEYHPCYFSCGKVRLGGFSPEHFQMEIIGNIYENPERLKTQWEASNESDDN